MKQVLKVILITFLCTIGGVALLLGGAYVFGVFNEKVVYAEDLAFSQAEIISAEPFSLRITTATEGVTKKSVKLEALRGGERIINFPETVNIGEDFFISPVTNANNQNVGGVVELYAKYDERTSNQSVVASCKILIDVNVESCEVKISSRQYELGQNVLLGNIGDKLTDLVSVSPANAIKPYVLKSFIDTTDSLSIFNSANFSDKKIFLALSQTATFVVDGVETSSTIELPYSYDVKTDDFYLTQKIEIMPKAIGTVALKSFVCSTYKTQKDVDATNVKEMAENREISSADIDFLVKNYSVVSMNTASSEPIEINYGEDISIFLNNDKASEVGGLNLGIELVSNNPNSSVDNFLLINNVFIKIVGTKNIVDLKDSLRKLDGTGSENGKLNVSCDMIDLDAKSTWCLKYKYSDFFAYYNYKLNPKEDNRIEVQVSYINEEDDKTIGPVSYYLIPKAREIETIKTKYEEGKSQIVYESGKGLSLTRNDFDIVYKNGIKASFDTIGYFLRLEEGVVFYPEKNGNYMTKFSFTPTESGELLNFVGLNSWCGLNNSAVTFTQGENSCTITFKEDGLSYLDDGKQFTFNANEKVDVVINSLSKKTALSNFELGLFSVTIGETAYTIKLRQVKFYDLNEDLQNTIPVLSVNGVTIAGEYDFVTIDDEEYIFLNTNSPMTLTGIGSFTIVAKNIYKGDEGVIYFLGKEDDVKIYVYEDISSLKVYSYTAENPYGNMVLNATFDENNGSGILFITSDQLETLRRLVELGKNEGNNRIKVLASQRIGELTLTDAQKRALASQNAGAITFGEPEEVIDKENKLIGYTVSYTIGNVYTLKFGNVELENIFDITVRVDGAGGSAFDGTIVYDGGIDSNIWTVEVVDKVFKYAEIKHNYTGGTYDNPIALTANADGEGNLAWQVAGGNLERTITISYGLKYLKNDVDLIKSVCSNKFALTYGKNGKNIDNPSFYCSLDNNSIRFKNVPYDANGVYYELRIYVPESNKDDTNCFYRWNDSAQTFERVLYEALNENNGAVLYFNVKGLNVTIEANKLTLNGTANAEYNLFGTNGIFKISGNGNVKLNQILNCVMSSDMREYLSVNENYTKFKINSNLLKDEDCTFVFYAGEGSNSNPIKIKVGESNIDSYAKTILSAFEIDYVKNFIAPCTDIPFATIKYKNNGNDATGVLDYLISVESKTQIAVVKENSLLISFKTMTGTEKITVTLTLKYKDSDISKQIVYNDVTVSSKYSDNDFILGTKNENNDYEITAGVEYRIGNNIKFDSSLEADKLNINEVTIDSFTNATEEDLVKINDPKKTVNDSILATKHLTYMSGTIGIFNFKSTDLKDDKFVKIVFKMTFQDGGILYVEKVVKIKANLSIVFNATKNYKSGENIDLGDNTKYLVTQNGQNLTLPSKDFAKDGKYTRASFAIVGDGEKYFVDAPNVGENYSICNLLVRSASSDLDEQENVAVKIIFSYQVEDKDYVLDFEFDFILNIYFI